MYPEENNTTVPSLGHCVPWRDKSEERVYIVEIVLALGGTSRVTEAFSSEMRKLMIRLNNIMMTYSEV
jgi:hypothetical protein